MKVAVLGTGNVGHAVAAHFARGGAAVWLCNLPGRGAALSALASSQSIAFNGALGSGTATIEGATCEIGAAVEGAHLVVYAVPAYVLEEGHAAVRPFLRAGQVVLTIGCFGALRLLQHDPALQSDGIAVVELATSPFPARTFQPGSVELYGTRKVLPAFAYPAAKESALTEMMTQWFPNLSFQQHPLAPSFLSTNPVVHAPLMMMNAGRVETGPPESWSLFRDGATPAVAATMLSCDAERRAIAGRLRIEAPLFAAGSIADEDSLPEAATKLSQYLRTSAMHIDPRHRTPESLAMRYVLEDIPFAFAAWAAIGARLGAETPTLTAIVALYEAVRRIIGGRPSVTLTELGLADHTAEQLLRLARATD